MEVPITTKTIDKGESIEVKVGYGDHDVFKDDVGLYGELYPQALKAVIHRIFVPEEDQGKGYGRKIFAAFEALAREKNYKSVRIGLMSNINMRDLKILLKLGFTCVDKENAVYEKAL